MRICPKCGYEDDYHWRHSKYSYWIDFTEYDWFLEAYPQLCPLEPGGIVQDEHYVYRRMLKRPFVERKYLGDYEREGWVAPMESRNDIHDFRKYWDVPEVKQTKLADLTSES